MGELQVFIPQVDESNLDADLFSEHFITSTVIVCKTIK